MAEHAENHASYVDCPAIAAGTILALAISIIFVQFGSAIGLSMTSDVPLDQENAFARVIAVGLWVLWVQVLASLIGGYIAGRMRHPFTAGPSHEREIRDGAHGLLAWAAGTVAVTIAVSLMTAFAALGVAENVPEVERTADILKLEHNAGIIVAFSAAATSMIAAVAAWWAATLGGEHRDANTDHSSYISFRRRK